ncbi:class I SAM-dependent methyltransferase [Paenibacillus pasadenensis]|uniref:class I SAM-dependent methyltransferase n=1 Tax=Paenibacillus pasadenensis TaxID=217090 RepID=UPI00203DFDC2|nr:class I SAM-dependent methyltransferase [Paenibacillus pasadenensis]MCM3746701.1 class I SAM-dependent methyltransferase [Paenibacillus pasadenensis]
MSGSVKKQFELAAAGYDEQRRGLIPCYDDFYGSALNAAWTDAPQPTILELGAGTGLFSGMLRRKYPQGNLTLMDFSGSMLAKAKQRFLDDDNVQLIEGNMTQGLPVGKFDLIVSSLAIHHLTHEHKRLVFRHIRERLAAGGRFVNADQTAAESPLFDELYREQWLKEIYDGRVSKEAADASVRRRAEDINAKTSEQLGWLREAGFEHADCVYKFREFTVFCAM